MATTVKNKMSGLLMEVGAEKKMKGSSMISNVKGKT
jgi:hypothetical protein